MDQEKHITIRWNFSATGLVDGIGSTAKRSVWTARMVLHPMTQRAEPGLQVSIQGYQRLESGMVSFVLAMLLLLLLANREFYIAVELTMSIGETSQSCFLPVLRLSQLALKRSGQTVPVLP